MVVMYEKRALRLAYLIDEGHIRRDPLLATVTNGYPRRGDGLEFDHNESIEVER